MHILVIMLVLMLLAIQPSDTDPAAPPPPPQVVTQLTRPTKEELENQKLALEIKQLQTAWWQNPQTWIGSASVLAVIIGALITLRFQKDKYEIAEEQLQLESERRTLELRKTEDARDAALQTAEVAKLNETRSMAKIAAAQDAINRALGVESSSDLQWIKNILFPVSVRLVSTTVPPMRFPSMSQGEDGCYEIDSDPSTGAKIIRVPDDACDPACYLDGEGRSLPLERRGEAHQILEPFRFWNNPSDYAKLIGNTPTQLRLAPGCYLVFFYMTDSSSPRLVVQRQFVVQPRGDVFFVAYGPEGAKPYLRPYTSPPAAPATKP